AGRARAGRAERIQVGRVGLADAEAAGHGAGAEVLAVAEVALGRAHEDVAEERALLERVAAVLAPADRAFAVEPDRDVHARRVDVREQAAGHALLAGRVAGAGLPLRGNADRARVRVRRSAAVLGADAMPGGQRAADD